MNPALDKVSTWMWQNGLKLAHHKSEALVLKRMNKFSYPDLLVDGHTIHGNRSIRYLGVQLDSQLSFSEHIQQASRRATESALAIGRLMPKLGGSSQSKRALLSTFTTARYCTLPRRGPHGGSRRQRTGLKWRGPDEKSLSASPDVTAPFLRKPPC